MQRLAVRGRRREIGIGGFPLLSLDEAREKQTFADRRLARVGGDPVAARREGDEPTFAEAAERVWSHMWPVWRNPLYCRDWMRGRLRVREVAFADRRAAAARWAGGSASTTYATSAGCTRTSSAARGGRGGADDGPGLGGRSAQAGEPVRDADREPLGEPGAQGRLSPSRRRASPAELSGWGWMA